MKTKSIITLAALTLALIGTFTLSSCKTTNGDAGTHSMGNKTNTWPMSNSSMPGMR